MGLRLNCFCFTWMGNSKHFSYEKGQIQLRVGANMWRHLHPRPSDSPLFPALFVSCLHDNNLSSQLFALRKSKTTNSSKWNKCSVNPNFYIEVWFYWSLPSVTTWKSKLSKGKTASVNQRWDKQAATPTAESVISLTTCRFVFNIHVCLVWCPLSSGLGHLRHIGWVSKWIFYYIAYILHVFWDVAVSRRGGRLSLLALTSWLGSQWAFWLNNSVCYVMFMRVCLS